MNGYRCECECAKLKKRVQELCFSLIETGLYLDSHPCCGEAIKYFAMLKEQYREAVQNYEKVCGPLTFLAGGGESCFTWVKAPWPWELEAN